LFSHFPVQTISPAPVHQIMVVKNDAMQFRHVFSPCCRTWPLFLLDRQCCPDSYDALVLYYYRAVRNPKASVGAELVPELIPDRSGVGFDGLAVDPEPRWWHGHYHPF